MLASYLGIDTFMKGVSAYLEANAYGNAKAQSLWKHLGKASGRDVATMADSWINNPGYPVLTVEENLAKGEITLMQSRFLSSGDARQNDDTITWHIPLAIKGLDGGQNAILSTKQQTFSGVDNHFYIINAEGVGFYRVNYPPSRLAKLSTQLDKLSLADKISIIGSISALAMAGATPVTSLLAFIKGFRNETEPDAWVQLLDALSVVSGIFSDDSQIKDGLNQFKLRLIQDKAAGLSVDIAADDTYAIRRLRRLLRGNAVRSGHKEYAPNLSLVWDRVNANK
jgi:aminopeptidase N